jgi:hypothetical protein
MAADARGCRGTALAFLAAGMSTVRRSDQYGLTLITNRERRGRRIAISFTLPSACKEIDELCGHGTDRCATVPLGSKVLRNTVVGRLTRRIRRPLVSGSAKGRTLQATFAGEVTCGCLSAMSVNGSLTPCIVCEITAEFGGSSPAAMIQLREDERSVAAAHAST